MNTKFSAMKPPNFFCLFNINKIFKTVNHLLLGTFSSIGAASHEKHSALLPSSIAILKEHIPCLQLKHGSAFFTRKLNPLDFLYNLFHSFSAVELVIYCDGINSTKSPVVTLFRKDVFDIYPL